MQVARTRTRDWNIHAASESLGAGQSMTFLETNLDVRTAAASGVIVIGTLILMALAEKFAGLTRQMR